MFKDSYSNFTYTADGTRQTVIVDVAASYQHNWQDYNNAVWTAMFPPTSTAEAALNRCQDGSAVVGIWSNPKNWNMAFLCQSIPGYPAWITGTSTPLEQNWNPSCGAGGLCGYFLSCSGSDFLVGGPTGSEINCYHREDGSTILPQKGSCDSTDHTYSNMPAQGSFFALPTGTYLTGYYMGNYMNNKYAAYSYCSATVSSGSLGAAMSMGVVGGLPFPNYFNVFTFGNISGIRDVQGAVAAGGSIDANSFNINSANGSMGLVSTGLLKLVNGTVGGGIIYASGEDFTGVTYQTFANQAGKPLDIVTGKAMDFQDARTRLQAMSKNVSGLVANGSTNIAYGNITLKSKDPTLNIFLVSAADLKATHSIVVDVPTTSTLIINVSGANVSITNAGITVFVGANRILWNLYEATQFYSNSVYINGSILAPFARANTGGSINGTLIAETAESASEFYKAPFLNNWLVP
jgi:choice-of-anchor A domain-containing protein